MADVHFHPRVLVQMVSRDCHDLVSPVGAVNNGVELMEELGPSAGAEATQLIANSARQASIRLKNFRLCYGAAGTDQNIGFKEIREAFSDLIPEGGRISCTFAPDIGVVFSMPPRGFFKVVLNALILAEECLQGGGEIAVSAKADKSGLDIVMTGKNPGFRDGVEAALRGQSAPEELDARSIHAYLTGRFAAHFGLPISWSANADGGHLAFTVGVA